mmetsp:Transcript_6709/g.11945  ORF Transcript_6709/g.11945 Transcript_6709/m.11945 type:complete len:137 (+) Transcript_6709:52-462(+)|eukprot:CAMPEP_0197653286 /NCGR_PEP_ID=MMETSP1338-20131121/34962_1 /TAXON_ID=43686 ORGANISM="Pelagodinium beii, Strain RCC1491" /NCGR_SAMPLE_ID=MMETSP1338 /ASSEMBLY_ACC=CAM_ASM_000754 /LENGTH=136 /DNA_ID=CAMNT_0043228331 /DNA_START=51 /DNA_END=461 /DNA_ORIENTATION=-
MAPRRVLSRSNIIDPGLDLNGDGRVLRSEVKKAREQEQQKKLKRLRRQGVSRSNILDPQLDKNKDGRITRSESRAAKAKASAMKVMKVQKKPAAKPLKRAKRIPVRAPAVAAKTAKPVQRLKRTASRGQWIRSGTR